MCKEKYQGSQQHKENANKARLLAEKTINTCRFCSNDIRKANIKSHENSCISNPINIKICPTCKTSFLLSRGKRKNKFCSNSCSIISSNKSRVIKETSNIKRRNALKGKPTGRGGNFSLLTSSNNHCKIKFINCCICNNLRCVKSSKSTKTCGKKECIVEASLGRRTYHNGSRKNIPYFNKNENKQVILNSSWEVKVAKFLDEKNILWIRPRYIKWIDPKSKEHLYYPDFYLPDFDLYLDPKNPYCMKKDEEKMCAISKIVDVVYGSMKTIITCIENLK